MDSSTAPATLLEAVNTLITDASAHDLYGLLRDTLPLALRHPDAVRLAGVAAVLNPLLVLRLKNPDAFDKVMGLIESRRVERGFDRLEPDPAPPAYNKVEYMREFMEQKRQRQRRAVEIENMLRPERDKLIGAARLEFMRQQSLRWKERLDAYIEARRTEAGGSLSREADRQAREAFWKTVDAHLDERGERARVESLKPVHQRSTDLGAPLDELVAALTNDPYAT